MINKIIQPLLLLIANKADSELSKYIEYLKTENKILRARLPDNIQTTEAERARLIRHGKDIPAKDRKHLVSIVTPRTFARWVSDELKPVEAKAKPPKKHGNPKHPQEIRDLIIQFAKDEGWGAGRIKGELYKLGYRNIGRSTINAILRENGFTVNPPPRDGTWREFLRQHRETLWACDFFTKNIVTLGGIVQMYILFFICPGTRQAFILGMTPNPNGEWMKQMTRNLAMKFDELPTRARYLIHDSDTKFTKDFREILKSEGVKCVRVGPRSPDQNASAERFVKTIKEECLDHFIVFGESHLRYLCSEFMEYYHHQRPHRGTDFHPPVWSDESASDVETIQYKDLVRKEKLGGRIVWYERKAA